MTPPSDLDHATDRLRSAGCVFAEDEAALLHAAAGTVDELDAMVDRRVSGAPLEHVLGWAEFCGLRIVVEPGVFVPRRRTELLVEEAVRLARPGSVVVDLCCGSGAVLAALSASVDGLEMYAVDIDPVSLGCATRNLDGTQVSLLQGDLDGPLPPALNGRIDLLVASPPYVPTEALQLMPVEAREHEPRVALDGGADGLDVVRRVIASATRLLTPGGVVIVETSDEQAEDVVQACARLHLEAASVRSEELAATVVRASRA